MNNASLEILALAHYINSFLSGQSLAVEFSEYPVAQTVAAFKFQNPTSEPNLDKGMDIQGFLAFLESQKAKKVKLHFLYDDNMIENAAFMNAGGYWFMKAELEGLNDPTIWYQRYRYEDIDGEQQLFSYYVLRADEWDFEDYEYQLDEYVEDFKNTLMELEEMAKEANLDEFIDRFKTSLLLINGESKPDEKIAKNFRGVKISDKSISLIDACSKSDVFWGMGSWLDNGPKDHEDYESITNDLYFYIHTIPAVIINRIV